MGLGKVITLRLDDDDYYGMIEYCYANDTTIAIKIRRMIKDFLNKEAKKNEA